MASAAPPGGYWLSVDLAGDSGARVQASAEMAGVEQRAFGVDPLAEVPGEMVARVPNVQDAMSWVARWVFDASLGWPEDAGALRLASAPRVGGSLFSRFGVRVRALIVTGSTPDDGVREISWPVDQRQTLPADLDWRPAALIPSHAALFAAPAPSLPPARERSASAHRSGGLYLLGSLDRCEGVGEARRCMRWVQVIARDGDRFVPGYLPNFQVAEVDGWTRAAGGLPRAQVRASTLQGLEASYLVVVRLADNRLHQSVVRTRRDANQAPGFVEHELTIEGDQLRLAPKDAAGQPAGTPIYLPLSPAMDLRVRGAAPPASLTQKP